MKSLVPWLVTAVASVAAALFFIANRSKTDELAQIRPQLQQLENLQKESAELKANQLSTEEMERIRKNTDELVRLRNEVRQLREAEKQLTKQLQAETAATQRAQEQAAAARTQALTVQSQVQTQMLALAASTNAAPLLTAEQQAFASRYGVAFVPVGQQAAACINHLRQLVVAKQQWALENNKAENATPSTQDILPYLGNEFPKCPSGGVYTLNAVGTHATCSTPGHTLPQER